MTQKGYIKRTPVSEYKVQRRGGKGIRGMTTQEDDYVKHLFVVSSHDTILFFTNFGTAYHLNAYEIPEGSRTAKGQNIINLLQLEPEERVEAMFPVKEDDRDENSYFVMVTAQGILKKTAVSLFKNIHAKGIRAIRLAEGDELRLVRIGREEDEVFMVTKLGMAIHFSLKDIRPISRDAMGVKGIRLDLKDQVIDTDIVGDNEYVLCVTESGYGKKTHIDQYNLQNRGGKGLITYRITKKTGPLIAACLVREDDEVLLMSQNNVLIRLNVQDISTIGRSTQGVKLKEVVNESDRVVAVAKYIEELDEENKENQ